MKPLALACILALSGCIQFARQGVADADSSASADAVGDTAGDLPVRDYAGEFNVFTSFMPPHYCDDGRGPVECCHNFECPHDVARVCDHGVCLKECSPTSECCDGGDDECGAATAFCNLNKCESVCRPACDGRECGRGVNCGKDDSCGTCPSTLECRGGRCLDPLVR